MRSLLRLSKWIDRLNQNIGALVFWLMPVMVLIGAFNALARKAGRNLGIDLSSNAYLELQWYLFSIIFLLGGAYTLKHDSHVRVDVLHDRLSRRSRRWIDILGHALFLLPFCLFMIWMSWSPVLDSWQRLEVSPDPQGLPRYPIKSIIPLAFVLLALQSLAEIIKHVHALSEPEVDEPPAREAHL